jgi:type I restriction enzyme S subunit
VSAAPGLPLRRLFKVVNGGTPSGDAENWDGGVAWATPVDLGAANGEVLMSTERTLTEKGLETGSRAVPAESLLISTRAPIGYVAETSTRTAFNQGCRGLVALAPLDPRFFRHQLSALGDQLMALGQGSTFLELSGNALADLRIAVPPLETQTKVADFLDRETKRIDALIAAKGRLVRLLIEAEQRLLIDQVGDWRTANVWSLRQARTEVVTGPFGTQLTAGEYVDDGVPVINPTHITRNGDIAHDRRVSVSEDAAERLKRHRVTTGDILLGRKGDVGRSAIVGVEHAGWVCGSDAIAVRTNPVSLDARFLAILLQIDLYRQQLYARSTGAMVASVNEDTLLDFRVPRLSLARQGVLVNRMNRVMLNRRTAIDRISASQILLEECRQAMVSAAVTGQLDIPEEA